MPLPKPSPNESQAQFIQRCMSDDKMKKEFPDQQRLAVCSAQYKQSNNKKRK